MKGNNIGYIVKGHTFFKSKNIGASNIMHCPIHQQAHYRQIIGLENVMYVAIKTINFIRFHGLIHQQFQHFLLKISDRINQCGV